MKLLIVELSETSKAKVLLIGEAGQTVSTLFSPVAENKGSGTDCSRSLFKSLSSKLFF